MGEDDPSTLSAPLTLFVLCRRRVVRPPWLYRVKSIKIMAQAIKSCPTVDGGTLPVLGTLVSDQ